MKKQLLNLILFPVILLCLLSHTGTHAQGIWRSVLNDSYEYTTVIPHLVPGTTYHNTPKSFSVHSGALSAYMNFVNGLPAGAMFYERPVAVCPNVPVRVSAWVTTTNVNGLLCDISFTISDVASNTLDSSGYSVARSPIWTPYQSAVVTPASDTIIVRVYTNLAGSAGGNDLSMDDLMVENYSPVYLGSDTAICNTQSILLNAGSGFSSYLWSNGDTTQTITASTTTPGVSIHDYFVVATNANGCTFSDTVRVTFLQCIGWEEPASGNVFSVSPNPSGGYLNVKSQQKVLSMSLLNLTGQMVKEFMVGDRIDVGDIAKGYYFLEIQTTSMQKSFVKVLIE